MRPGMRLTLDGIDYDYYPHLMMNVEAMAVEDKAGLTLTELGMLLKKGSTKALTAILWIMRKRSEPTLRYTDVTYPMGDLQISYICDQGHALAVVGGAVPTECDECSVGKEPAVDPASITT